MKRSFPVCVGLPVVVFLVLVTFCGLNSSAAVQIQEQHGSSGSSFFILHFSDFHYDPFFGTSKAIGGCTNEDVTKYGVAGCDSSEFQIRYALADANQTATRLLQSNPGASVMIIYTGDWMRHQMATLPDPHSTAVEIMDTLCQLWLEYFPEGILVGDTTTKATINDLSRGRVLLSAPHPVIPLALGNDDFIPDYHFNVVNATGANKEHSESHQLLGKIGTIFHQYGLLGEEQRNDFGNCGFFSTDMEVSALSSSGDIVVKNISVISLNTMIWSISIKPQPPTTMADPCGQFSFLNQTLANAKVKGQGVILISHMAPDFFQSRFLATFRQILGDYRGTVMSQFYGHIHRMSWLLTAAEDDLNNSPPAFIGGPITRASGTNPCYGVVEFELFGSSNTSQIEAPSLTPATHRRLGNTAGAVSSTANPVGQVKQITQRYLSAGPSFNWAEGMAIPQAYGINNLTSKSLYQLAWNVMGGDSKHGQDIFKVWYKMFVGDVISAKEEEEYSVCVKHTFGKCQRALACTLLVDGIVQGGECVLHIK